MFSWPPCSDAGGLPRVFVVARPALSPNGSHDRVLRRVFVALWTMGLGGIDGGPRNWTTQDVLPASNWLEVGWIAASSVAAQMIYLQARGNFAHEMHITPSMSRYHARTIPKRAVPSAVVTGHPLPTSRVEIHTNTRLESCELVSHGAALGTVRDHAWTAPAWLRRAG
jgi:hypothetical protein